MFDFTQCLQGVHPLFLCEQSLYAIVFNVNDPFKINSVIHWMLLMRSKVSGFIIWSCYVDFKQVCSHLYLQLQQVKLNLLLNLIFGDLSTFWKHKKMFFNLDLITHPCKFWFFFWKLYIIYKALEVLDTDHVIWNHLSYIKYFTFGLKISLSWITCYTVCKTVIKRMSPFGLKM